MAGSSKTLCVSCFLSYSLDWKPTQSSEPQLAASNNGTPVSRISTSCGSNPEPNLHPSAHDSRLGWSWQVTHLGKPVGRKTRL
jgi:hypothetical protein